MRYFCCCSCRCCCCCCCLCRKCCRNPVKTASKKWLQNAAKLCQSSDICPGEKLRPQPRRPLEMGVVLFFFPRKLNRNHMQIQIEFSINPKSASPGELSSSGIIFGYTTLSLSLSLLSSFSHHVDVFKYASFAVCCNLIGLAFGRLPAPIPFPFTVPFSIQPMRQLIYAETSQRRVAES